MKWLAFSETLRDRLPERESHQITHIYLAQHFCLHLLYDYMYILTVIQALPNFLG